jgi:hypothetical protein
VFCGWLRLRSAHLSVSPATQIAHGHSLQEWIGFDSRIPNYNLPACYAAEPAFQQAVTLGIWDSLKCTRLKLWDEERQRMITFAQAEAERLKRTGAAKSAPSGKLVMDEAVYKLIQKFLHPDLTTDPTEKQRRHEALTAFHGLPIAKVTMDERKAAEKEARRWAAETEEKRKQGEAIYRKRRAAGLKAQETRRRNAEAKAREAGQKPAGQPH